MAETSSTVSITIDGRELVVAEGELLIKAAEDNGTYIPRFCWHRRMNPVGMCRMCLVNVDTGRGPALVPSCTATVAEGMVVETSDPAVVKAQEGVLEFLLINHPLDCPVCDRGGECPLQDHVMAYGPGESRFVEEKRHFEKPIPINDLVLLDRERCILCARCTRFSEEVSGDPLIEFQERGNLTQVNTFPDEPFSSYFSGNTVQICPVGALTATPYRFKARPWDLIDVESTCPHCTSGDRIKIQASQNRIVRLLGLDADPTNRGWLSDKCRFGFEYLTSPDRVDVPLIKGPDGEFHDADWAEALDIAAGLLGEVITEHRGGSVAALGGARGTNEEAYALSKFMRSVVGSNHVDAQMGDGLDPQFLAGTVDRAEINDLDSAAAILLWGPDLKEEHPTLYLRVRHAAQELGARLIVIHPRSTGLDDRAEHKLTYKPGSGASLLEELKSDRHPDVTKILAEGPLVALVGLTGQTEDRRLSEAVAAWIRTFDDSRILPLARRSNTYGALDMGLAPGLLPGRATISGIGCANLEENWGMWPKVAGLDAAGIVDGLGSGDLMGLILMGADPVQDMPDGKTVDEALESAEVVIAVDMFVTGSSKHADVIFPALGFGEKSGTVTNVEGRVQKVNRLVGATGQGRADWSILDDLAGRLGSRMGFFSAEMIGKEIAHVAPAYEGVTWDVLDWEQRDGVVVPYENPAQPLNYVPVGVELKDEESDLVLHSARTMYDDGVLMRHSESLRDFAHDGVVGLNPEDAQHLGLESGDAAGVSTDAGSATLKVFLDDSLEPGVVYVPVNQRGVPGLGSSPAVNVSHAGGGGS